MKRAFSRLIGLLAITTIAGAWIGYEALSASAQSANQAAVVVRLDDDTVVSQCVSFEAQTISGLDLLQDSGLDVELRVEGFGNAVCRINGMGCSPDACFCLCSGGGDCTYWSYWHLKDGTWSYAAAGATSYQVSHGEVDGWSWGPGSVAEAVEPPLLSYEEICNQDDGSMQPVVGPAEGNNVSLVNLGVFGGLLLLIVIGLVQVRKQRRSL